MDKLDKSLDELSKLNRKQHHNDDKKKPKVVKAAPRAGEKTKQPLARPISAGRGGGSGILARIGGGSAGTMVIFRNLDFKVTNRDIRELASTIGEIISGEVVLGSSGRPSGMAEVVFVSKGDAQKAVNKFNGITLDGRPMDVSLGGDIRSGSSGPKASVFGSALSGGGRGGGNGPTFSVVLSDPAMSRSQQRPRGGDDRGRVIKQQGGGNSGGGKGTGNKGKNNGGRGGGGSGAGGGGKRDHAPTPSQEDLDRQLEAFLAKK